MQDKKFDLCISMAHAWAYTAWASTVALLLIAVVEDDLIWSAFGLAMSAVAATLHIRCFLIGLQCHIRAAYEFGRETERVTQLRSLH